METNSNDPGQTTEQGLRQIAQLIGTGRGREAIAWCQQLMRAMPQEPRLHFAMAVALLQVNMPEEAAEAYRHAIRIQPTFFEAYLNLSGLLIGRGKFEEAIPLLAHAAELRPQSAEVLVNMSTAQRDLWRLDEAARSARAAISLNANIPEAHNALGSALAGEGKFEQAISEYRAAIASREDYAPAHLNLALALLVMGQLTEGFAEYEWRLSCGNASPPALPMPRWNGEDPQGKTILLYPEQGLGDAIHFSRYAELIRQRGGHAWMMSNPSLRTLFAESAGIERVLESGESASGCDMHCPLASLPHVFGTTLGSIPGEVPYLQAPPRSVERWRERVKRPTGEVQIGLAWQGNPANRNDVNRSIPLEKFVALRRNPKVRYHSLQITPPPADAPIELKNWSEDLKDFGETAGLIAQMDLVISVDTAVAHLAGAMGKDVLLLLPDPPDWRWMLDRTDSPWYPTMRLFRQKVAGDWESAIAELPMDQFE